MQVNGQFIETCGKFGYDGCHKIYIAEDLADVAEMRNEGYELHSTCELPEIWGKSCSMRFIENWKLTKTYVPQCKDAVFTD